MPEITRGEIVHPENPPLPDHVAAQIDALALDRSRPLIACDADEVLLYFVAGLERHLARSGMVLTLESFRLHGNIRHRQTGDVVSDEDVTAQLKSFYAASHHDLEGVQHAAGALERLSAHAQIVVLTNVALEAKSAREANLQAVGLPFPVIANSGLKGAAVSALAQRTGPGLVFIDDIPHNLSSVKAAAPATLCIHFIADPRLAALLPQAEDSDHRARDWLHIEDLIRGHLDRSASDDGFA